MMTVKVATFYLYLILSGAENTLIHAGTYQSKASCEALGGRMKQQIEERFEEEAAPGVEMSIEYRCTTKPMDQL